MSLNVRVRAVTGWFGERLPVSMTDLRELTNEPVPNHLKRWWFALGGTPAYLFVVQIVTGLLLAIYYRPSAESAYESVRYITEEVTFGWYLRGLHRWGATLMVAAVILHQMRVYFTGSYRKPREINWMVGMCLLVSTLMLGFTGYSLVYEQLSYWGATVGANIAGSVPVVGELMRRLMLGGDGYNPNTLPRFFVLHAAVLPMALIFLLVVHIGIIRLQGVTEFTFDEPDEPDEPDDSKVPNGTTVDRPVDRLVADGTGDDGTASSRDETASLGPKKSSTFSFFPDHMLSELAVGLVLMVVLSFLATVYPPLLGPRANALITPEVIKPEWFFYVAFRWLKLFSGTFAILSMGFVVFVMFLWPFIDAWIRRRTRFQEASVWIGIAGVMAIIGLTLWEAVVAH